MALIVGLEEVVTIVSIIAGGTGIWWGLRRNAREERAQDNEDTSKVLTINDMVVKALERQNKLMEQQNTDLRESLAKVERRNERLEQKVDELQSAYNQLVMSVSQGGICLNASSCNSYNPGDRRKVQGEYGVAQG